MKKQIFKDIFTPPIWDSLPIVIQKHYANHAFSHDETIVHGTLDVYCHWILKPLFYLLKNAPPVTKNNIPVTVYFNSQENSEAFCFNRIFYINPNKPFHFKSKMFHHKNNEVIEIMNYGICWHLLYSFDSNKNTVFLTHKRYSLKLGKFHIPLPMMTWIIGACHAHEIPLGDNEFYMCATITHWLFGTIYEYKGTLHFEQSNEVLC